MTGRQQFWLEAAARKGAKMERKQQSSSISPQPDAEKKKKESTKLSEEELKKVAGGLSSDPCEGGQLARTR
jgi:hypothetical protein